MLDQAKARSNITFCTIARIVYECIAIIPKCTWATSESKHYSYFFLAGMVPIQDDQVQNVLAHIDYPYEDSDRFSAQIVWTPLPGVTEYQVLLLDCSNQSILVC